MAYIYVVRCKDNSLYTGIARDIRMRIRDHYYRTPRAAKYTKSHQVTALCALWETEEWSDAGKLEVAFKRLPKDAKESVLKAPQLVVETCNIIAPAKHKLDPKKYTPVSNITFEMCIAGDPPADSAQTDAGSEGDAE